MPFQLVATAGNQTFELPGGVTLVLGRALNSDIPVFDPTISRRHAQVTSDATGVEVRDLGARNGVFLNGVKIEKARVSPGDVVTFGKVAFRLRETAKPSLPTPPSTRAQRAALTVLKPVPAPGVQRSGVGGVLGQTGAGIPSAAAAAAAVRGLRGEAPDEAAYADLLEVQQKLALLLEVSTALSRAIESDALLEKIVEFTFQILDADLVAVLLTDEHGELLP